MTIAADVNTSHTHITASLCNVNTFATDQLLYERLQATLSDAMLISMPLNTRRRRPSEYMTNASVRLPEFCQLHNNDAAAPLASIDLGRSNPPKGATK